MLGAIAVRALVLVARRPGRRVLHRSALGVNAGERDRIARASVRRV